ncbi:MAG: hypothetical protein Q8S35_01060, partial [bacterium]|nr:hypothetical protein [bacterium]
MRSPAAFCGEEVFNLPALNQKMSGIAMITPDFLYPAETRDFNPTVLSQRRAIPVSLSAERIGAVRI